MNYWVAYTVVLIFGLVIGAVMFTIDHSWQHRPGLKRWLENLALVSMTLFIAFMVAEIFFKVFFAQTDNRTFTLASRNWFDRYWVLNSMGYRDVEWSKEELKQKRKILVSGDSFAAGQGIENVTDRFSNRLGEKLGSDYLVMNIADVGLSTREEINRLKSFPYKPEILILQYYLNDIRYAAEQRNLKFIQPNTNPWPIIEPLISNSYTLNFIYWRTVLLGPSHWQGDGLAWLKTTFNDPEVWWLHQQELLTIYEGAKSENVKLIVVVFPVLTDVAGSQEMAAKVVNFFQERGVPVLDVSALIKNEPLERLVLSNLDAHPSPWLHQHVTDRLYEIVLQIE